MIWGKGYRQRPVMNVIDEIQYLQKVWGIDFFYLADDTFGINKEWTKEFLLLCSKLKLPPFALQTRVDHVKEFLCRDLKRAGCIQVDVGIEAGNDRLLNRINKKTTLNDIWQAYHSCSRNGLRFFGFLMVNLPGETEDDLKDLEKLVKNLKPNGVEVSICTPFPGTTLHTTQGLELIDNKKLYSDYQCHRDKSIFRMARHSLDFNKIIRKLYRILKVQPMFERMWPAQSKYWKALIKSNSKIDYIKAWVKDIPYTFMKWWAKRFYIDKII